MAKIKCDQHECKYNNKNFCIKEGIYLNKDAFCESYRKGNLDKTYAFEIASFEDDEKVITCMAKNCKYNKECKCKAKCIYVRNNTTTCKDYEAK
jgi:hypothetical protein